MNTPPQKMGSLEPPEGHPPPQESCPHLDLYELESLPICNLATYIADEQVFTSEEVCNLCKRCVPPQGVNEIVLALADVDIEKTQDGPGTQLHKWITWFVPEPENCGCGDRVKIMNAWGKERCRKEKKTILGWLRESALDNNYPYSEKVISYLLDWILK